MIRLLDVNVLIALAWPNHVHHAAAHAWFASVSGEGWATCSITEVGFVRVSANAAAIPTAVSPIEAGKVLGAMTALPGHTFWPDATRLIQSDAIPLSYVTGHRQVTDAHLIALGDAHGGRVATFDRRMLTLGGDQTARVELVPLG